MNSTTNKGVERAEARLAWLLITPVLATIGLIAMFPLAWTVWESLHVHDLRQPGLGEPFVGFANYSEALRQPRFWQALAHTAFFTALTVAIELVLGLVLAMALNRAYRGRGLVRLAVLLPWAIPTVVVGLIWSFMFDSQAGIVNAMGIDLGLMSRDRPLVWFSRPYAAWLPIILADVWRMTPFVTLLLLAGLQNIDSSLYEAASLDGASAWSQFRHVTLPLLQPAILVVCVFRTLDGFRVFDLIYVLTGGGPGTATEPVVLYAFDRLLNNLRFGYGSALSVLIFLITFLLALIYIKVLGARLMEKPA